MLDNRLRSSVHLVFAVLVLSVTALGADVLPDSTKPEDVAKTFVSLLQQKQYGTVYAMLADSQRQIVTLEDYTLVLKKEELIGGTIDQFSLSFQGERRACVKLVLKPIGDGPNQFITFDLIKASDGKWWVSHGDYLLEAVKRAKREIIPSALRHYGELWVKQDYASMLSMFADSYLSSHFGNSLREAKLKDSRDKWEKEYGKLEGISCCWDYVRYTDSSTATIPAKFCYEDPDNKEHKRFAPYLVTFRLDLASKQWKITELVRTPRYQRPPEVAATTSADTWKIEDEAIGGK